MWYIILLTWLYAADANTWIKSDNTWYFISSYYNSYNDAIRHCTDLNGYLTNLEGGSLGSVPFASELKERVPYYIGAWYDASRDKYIWLENEHEVEERYLSTIREKNGYCLILFDDKGDSADDPWKLSTANCTYRYSYICKSCNQRCNTIYVKGFQHKLGFNGEYSIESNNKGYTACATRYLLYVHKLHNATVYVCKTVDNCAYRFYKDTLYEGYIYSEKPSPHLVNSDAQAQELVAGYYPGWNDINIDITCIEYKYQVTIPTTTRPTSSSPKSTTTMTQETTRITRQSTQRSTRRVTLTQTSQPTHRPTSPQTLHPANRPTLMQTSQPSNRPIVSSTSETGSSTDNLMSTILLYMNIAIWTLVAIFLCVDAFLFVWFMRLRKQK